MYCCALLVGDREDCTKAHTLSLSDERSARDFSNSHAPCSCRDRRTRDRTSEACESDFPLGRIPFGQNQRVREAWSRASSGYCSQLSPSSGYNQLARRQGSSAQLSSAHAVTQRRVVKLPDPREAHSLRRLPHREPRMSSHIRVPACTASS